MIEYLDPRAEPGMGVEPYQLSVDLVGAVDIGLLANGFPDSVAFLQHVEEALAALLPEARFHHYNKGDASSVVSDAMLDTIVAECQAVVAAYGHWGSCTTGTVRDGVKLARRGTPAVALVTEKFWPQGDFVARSVGMPTIPRTRLPHPVAGSGHENMTKVAALIGPEIVAWLTRGAPS